MALQHKGFRAFLIEGLAVTAIITEVQSETLGFNRFFVGSLSHPGRLTADICGQSSNLQERWFSAPIFHFTTAISLHASNPVQTGGCRI
jgi:hypothetical protein